MVGMWLGSSGYETAPPAPTLPPPPGRRVLSQGSPWLRALVCCGPGPGEKIRRAVGSEAGFFLPCFLIAQSLCKFPASLGSHDLGQNHSNPRHAAVCIMGRSPYGLALGHTEVPSGAVHALRGVRAFNLAPQNTGFPRQRWQQESQTP